jgi:hypothetical protein
MAISWESGAPSVAPVVHAILDDLPLRARHVAQVSLARFSPTWIASSNPFLDAAVISVTGATDMEHTPSLYSSPVQQDVQVGAHRQRASLATDWKASTSATSLSRFLPAACVPQQIPSEAGRARIVDPLSCGRDSSSLALRALLLVMADEEEPCSRTVSPASANLQNQK